MIRNKQPCNALQQDWLFDINVPPSPLVSHWHGQRLFNFNLMCCLHVWYWITHALISWITCFLLSNWLSPAINYFSIYNLRNPCFQVILVRIGSLRRRIRTRWLMVGMVACFLQLYIMPFYSGFLREFPFPRLDLTGITIAVVQMLFFPLD